MRPEEVARAYDVVAADYAGAFTDVEAEQLLDLAMLDAFLAEVPRGGGCWTAGAGRAGSPGGWRTGSPAGAVRSKASTSRWA